MAEPAPIRAREFVVPPRIGNKVKASVDPFAVDIASTAVFHPGTAVHIWLRGRCREIAGFAGCGHYGALRVSLRNARLQNLVC